VDVLGAGEHGHAGRAMLAAVLGWMRGGSTGLIALTPPDPI
jgi:hypothetical protein